MNNIRTQLQAWLRILSSSTSSCSPRSRHLLLSSLFLFQLLCEISSCYVHSAVGLSSKCWGWPSSHPRPSWVCKSSKVGLLFLFWVSAVYAGLLNVMSSPWPVSSLTYILIYTCMVCTWRSTHLHSAVLLDSSFVFYTCLSSSWGVLLSCRKNPVDRHIHFHSSLLFQIKKLQHAWKFLNEGVLTQTPLISVLSCFY